MNLIRGSEAGQWHLRERGFPGASQLQGTPEGGGSIPAHGVGALLWALVSSVDPTKNY